MKHKPKKGSLLLSEPFLPDPNFRRTVILIAEHNEGGTVGYVLNHPTVLTVSDLFEEFQSTEPVFLGGPVGHDTFHFLHTHAGLPGAGEVLPGVYWGGDFEQLQFFHHSGIMKSYNVRYFAGYSGWGAGQLEAEIAEKSWIVIPGIPELVFSDSEDLWKRTLGEFGGSFSWMNNAPDDVSLN